ncbi:DUF1592 domain-containing protein [Lignipirellula cremea]|uniref:Cytochrome c domain-containing protein n=1 Tax=Lignipirellula cremea TaxID=2528010 RepID=A0A518DKC8_9BACT|nr:DUF1592 domain-containing protein [Lignipirellula cremea]QDU92287.1 hypothetical protein Pla8534_00320 [Lignipirellula cremea]
MLRHVSIASLFCIVAGSTAFAADEVVPSFAAFDREVKPVLAKLCFGCHGPEKQEADLRLDQLDPDLFEGQDGGKWEEVYDQLGGGEMPPKDESQPTAAERKVITDWLHQEMTRAVALQLGTGGGVVMRRLTRYEYNYSLQDLLGQGVDYTETLPEDRAGHDGLKNNGSVLGMSPLLFDAYAATAKEAVRKALASREKPQTFFNGDAPTAEDRKALESPEIPKIFRYREEFAEFRPRPLKMQPIGTYDDGVVMYPGASLGLQYRDRPWEGRFRIRIRAGGLPDAQGLPPRLRVLLGFQRAAQTVSKNLVAEIAVTVRPENSEVFELTGYVENFPMPTKYVRTDSCLKIWLEHADPIAPQPLRRPIKIVDERRKLERAFAADPVDPAVVTMSKKKIAELEAELEKQDLDFAAWIDQQSRLYVDWLEFEGPYFDTWPPKTRVDLLPQPEQLDDPVYVRDVLRRFMKRSWRRPVTEEEVEPFAVAFSASSKVLGSDEALIDRLATVLTSPHFLYLVEPVGDSAGRQLTAHELATRLSYFVWASTPDEALTELADEGTLSTPEVLRKQVARMLDDPKAARFARHFATQWLNLDEMQKVAVNPEYYRHFESKTKEAMSEEPVAYFYHVLNLDRSALEFFDSDYAVVNQQLAAHYGLEGVRGPAFRPVRVAPDQHRGGLLTQAAFMLANSDGSDSHPILRGKWLLERLLNDPPPPPPADVPDLPKGDPEFVKLPLKEQLAIHRKQPACASCHDALDPWGLALENFDAIGQWRIEAPMMPPPAKGKPKMIPVDAAVELPGGASINGLEGLKKHLLAEKKEAFAEGFVRRLLAYALGRSVQWSDREEVDALTQRLMSQHDYRLRPLIEDIVLSEAFRSR